MISKYLENKIHFFLQIIFLLDIKGYIVAVNNPSVDVTFKWGKFKVTLLSQSQGFEIMDKFSIRHKFANLRKSASPWGINMVHKNCFVDMH